MYRFTISAIQTQVMTDRDTIRTHMPYVYVEQVLPIIINPASNTTVLHTDMHVINKRVCKRPETYFDTLQIMTHYASFQTTLVHVLIRPGVVRNVWLTPGSRVRMGSRCSKAIHAIGFFHWHDPLRTFFPKNSSACICNSMNQVCCCRYARRSKHSLQGWITTVCHQCPRNGVAPPVCLQPDTVMFISR